MVRFSVDEATQGNLAKRSSVRRMFTAIAPRYDLLNHLLSLNIDRLWRRRAVRRLAWERKPAGRYLDLCAGTLDLAAILSRQPAFRGKVVGADFVLPMLVRGCGKGPAILPVGADALELPFGDNTFDGVMIGFGVRNLADLDAGLAEAVRVLRPGDRFVVLEFTTPRFLPLRAVYLFYFCRVLPAIGRMVSQHTTAYSYLPQSVLAFPEPHELADRMRSAGLDQVGYQLLTGGLAAIYWGTKRWSDA